MAGGSPDGRTGVEAALSRLTSCGARARRRRPLSFGLLLRKIRVINFLVVKTESGSLSLHSKPSITVQPKELDEAGGSGGVSVRGRAPGRMKSRKIPQGVVTGVTSQHWTATYGSDQGLYPRHQCPFKDIKQESPDSLELMPT